jgi:hypothetical protein
MPSGNYIQTRPLWTFLDYKFERWQKDKGMRLDHFLLSPNLSVRLAGGGVDRWAYGQENASDNASHGLCSISRPESRFQQKTTLTIPPVTLSNGPVIRHERGRF